MTSPTPLSALHLAAGEVVDVIRAANVSTASLPAHHLRALAMEWPRLAAALATLMEAAEVPVPASLRRARALLAQEDTARAQERLWARTHPTQTSEGKL